MLEATAISLDSLVSTAQGMFDEGWRFLTLSAVDKGDEGVEILYHFDKALELKHFRTRAAKGQPIPSISGVYFAALLVENECRDLFGLDFTDLVLDFNRTLYLDEVSSSTAPFCKITAYSKKG